MSINFPPNLGPVPTPQSEPPLHIPGVGQLTIRQEQAIRRLISDPKEEDFAAVLNSVGITDTEKVDAIVKFIKEQAGDHKVDTEVKERRPSLFQMAATVSQKGADTLPEGLTDAQKGMVNQVAQGMVGDTTNYKNNLANLIALGATPAEILKFKKNAQANMEAQFAAGPPPGPRRQSLLSVGIKEPLLTQVIQYLMGQAGFYPPVDDLGRNFNDELSIWEKKPGRTAGDLQFAAEMHKLVHTGMTSEQIQSALNKFLGGKGTNSIFKLYGVDPKNFQALSEMLPDVHVTFPIPTDMENAYVQSYKIGEPTGKAIRDALDKYGTDFAGFKEYVKNTLLPSAPVGYQALIRELSGNQPVNTNLPPTRPDGSALFTYMNTSGLPDSQVYIQVTGVNPVTHRQCFIQYDRNGTAHYIDAKPGMNSQDYAFPLSYFNRGEIGKGASFYLPAVNGGRLYTSIGEPLKFNIDPAGGIIGPNPHRVGDLNNAVHWDKIEFTTEAYRDPAHQGMIFLNATAVDNVTLPTTVTVIRTDGTVHQGGLLRGVEDLLVNSLKSLGEPWTGLIQGNTILSVMDAASTGHFPEDYFIKPQKGQTKSWMDGFIEHYTNTPLRISTNDSITPGDDGKGIWTGQVDSKTHQITFTRTPPGEPSPPAINKVTIAMPNKTSELLSGTGDGWQMGSVQKMTNELCNLGLASGPKLVNGNWIPAFSDERIQEIINGLPNGPQKTSLQYSYREMKIQINLARDISVGVCTNTLGAKSEQTMTNRLCQMAQDGEIPKDILQGHKQVNGNWTPPFTDGEIKALIDKLPDSNINKKQLQLLQKMMSGSEEAPLCQDTFKGAFQTSYTHNPNMPAYAQFIDPVAVIVAGNAVKRPGHESDRLGDIYTHSYTDSTGHEGAANAIPSEFHTGWITLGNFGAQTSWTS